MNNYFKHIPVAIKTSFLTVLFLFVFIYIFARFFGPIPFSVNSVTTMKNDLFTVNGEGEATATPDTALINLGVTKTASNVEQAKNEVNTAANAIINELKSNGVKENEIKTTNYSINPNYDYNRGNQTITGYSVTQNLEIKVSPIEKANITVDSATKNGANMVGNIQFTLNDKEKDKLEQQAREQAINKAKAKANNIANASGIHLGKLINVQENGGFQPLPMTGGLDKVALETGNSQPATNLQPGENTVHISVTLSYETY